MIRKEPSTKPGYVKVTFSFPGSLWAESIQLVGDFNGWDARSNPFRRDRDDDDWTVVVDLPVGRRFFFYYLVDESGHLLDGAADATEQFPQQGLCSVIKT